MIAMTLHCNDLRPANQPRAKVTTKAGITIGAAWTPPPRPASADAERLQSALLDDTTGGPLSLTQWLYRRFARWV